MGLNPRSLRGLITGARNPSYPAPLRVETTKAPGQTVAELIAKRTSSTSSTWRAASFEDDGLPFGEKTSDLLAATATESRDTFTKKYMTDPAPDRGMTAVRKAELDREAADRRERAYRRKETADKRALMMANAENAVRLAVLAFPEKLKSGLSSEISGYNQHWDEILEDCLHRTNFRRTESDYGSHHGYVAKIDRLVREWSPVLTAEWIASNLTEKKLAPAEPDNEKIADTLARAGPSTSAFTDGLKSLGDFTHAFEGLGEAVRGAPRDDSPHTLPDDLLDSLIEAADPRRGSW